MDKSTENTIIEEMKRQFGSGLVSVVLFGSQARGTADEHSDIDLVVIAEGVPKDWRQQDEIIAELRMSPGLISLPVSILKHKLESIGNTCRNGMFRRLMIMCGGLE